MQLIQDKLGIMTKFQKFLTILIMPLCFVWFFLSLYHFYLDVLAWQKLTPDYTFYGAAIKLALKNILTFLGLYVVYRWAN